MIEEILKGVALGEEESFLGASEIIRAIVLGPDQAIEPYANYVRHHQVSPEEFSSLKSALIAYIQSPSTGVKAGAFAALKECRDPSLIEVLAAQLEVSLRGLLAANSELVNCIAALEENGARVAAGTYGIATVESNIESARSFLQARGVSALC